MKLSNLSEQYEEKIKDYVRKYKLLEDKIEELVISNRRMENDHIKVQEENKELKNQLQEVTQLKYEMEE